MSDLTAPLQLLTDWKTELSHSISSLEELLDALNLSHHQLSQRQQATLQFPLRVPRSFVSRMKPGDPNDPLLLQVLPTAEELLTVPGFIEDPLSESQFNPLPGVVHKYHNRLLLIVSPTCAVNCRYCFRRHFPYQENQQSKQDWQQALNYIEENSQLNEVIFSGGDPLAANDQFLSWLSGKIADTPHIKRLRIHTRLPVVIPSRVDGSLISWLTDSRLRPVVVLHINHPNEIDNQVRQAIGRLRDAGIHLLNQSVLLQGINNDAQVLAQLSEKLFDCGITPYYLHMLDPVQGAAHFSCSQKQALELYKQLQAALPGFLVPKLVREMAGERSKTVIAP